ncbi:MAG: M48 family metallopeptidase [Candidatus Tectomicrobia bacterium]|uniref:M48 family metallopeptidase n=1 Tax=Tectimicrobiota bacterium TaxID=2528274 RepID=A0A937VZQ5_UNCTE|nr:M48 family metallopeptidase [Candidatus Tectomicrobia bacterium]
MNLYAVIICATLLLDYALNLLADVYNLRALRPELPAEFADVYDADAYRKSQEYTRVQTQFGLLTSTCMLAVTLGFWGAGGFQALDTLVRAWDLGSIGTGLVYIGLLMVGRSLASLPFTLYSTFVIEARFGFNKTTWQTWLADMVKGLGLGLLLGIPLLAGILAFLTYAGPYAWLYCWLVVTAFTLGLQWLAPTWILPLFNTFTPLEPGALKEAILTYARTVQFPVEDVFVIDGSRRSSKSNAFFTGLGKHKRIALFDTLIASHTIPELVAVLAHEIGHYKMKHVVRNTVISMAHTGVMFFLLSVFLSHAGLFAAFYVQQPSVYAGLVFFGMLYTPIELVLSVAMQIMSRRHEYEADRYAVDTFAAPSELAQALKKLSVHNLVNLTPHPFYVFLHYSHPPMLQRIQAIQRAAVRS